ncbi:conserved hypothetical protein [Clavispora lusitaniae ATCC 42720]|uniref:Uncharacterized protein n=1 Tax=Clavispora lusitaniae (strain ATCC 42720) TaxID=306902 RepID=C4Y2S7_CLAL4|nr:uncharacterized protein CLUG_02840 [Clavispora lusitaniae ATCC 42720]EEQ38715.1 conserved hypothetical protein [Clavispora lusitaniae ATCC 42720]
MVEARRKHHLGRLGRVFLGEGDADGVCGVGPERVGLAWNACVPVGQVQGAVFAFLGSGVEAERVVLSPSFSFLSQPGLTKRHGVAGGGFCWRCFCFGFLCARPVHGAAAAAPGEDTGRERRLAARPRYLLDALARYLLGERCRRRLPNLAVWTT